MARLIEKKYASERRSSIDTTKASSSREIGHGDIPGGESMDTTHFTVVDAAGTVVTDTWHASVEDALEQAAFEYEALEWVELS